MKMKTGILKKLLAVALGIALLLTYVPMTASAAEVTEDSYYHRVVDVNTMDNWKKYFNLDELTTQNAGGVWTDKSVFTDASAFDGKIAMLDSEKNFLTALSTIAANKEIVGYATIPTDTVLVLDLSGSMQKSNSERDLINAANDAIQRLLENNENNRIGVVLYSASGSTGTSTYEESVTQILPIDRYTTASDGIYLTLNNEGTVSVDQDVDGTKQNLELSKTKTFGGGTYIQAGLWEAWEMFSQMDTKIGENNWQSDDDRMPILVLMSDGAPSTGTTYYDDVKNSQYTTTQNGGGGGNRPQQNNRVVKESNVGNGNEEYLTAGNAFLTQLTASYVMNRIENHYQQHNSDVRGLFYTLGFNIGNDSVATSVMNPDASTFTDSLWEAYDELGAGSLTIRVKNRNGNFSDVSINKNSYATSKSYVDQYFSASGTGLRDAFREIVEEILIQSRYYPTHLAGSSPDFSGYIEFTDTIGEYMEVKRINGILLGDTLFDGRMMASKIKDNSSSGLGTAENPTALGDEFIRAVKTRLGIADTTEAQILVKDAFDAGQLKYEVKNGIAEWSNYIAWYAKADGTYLKFWDDSDPNDDPGDAVYKVRSYGFLGETTGSIKNSDMMYMSVQVRTNIATGEQTLFWKIPAALVPLVTYYVTLEGTNVDEARNVNVTVEDKNVSPIRLIFESGLRSDLNSLNILRITDDKHIAEDNITRQFWTNHFDISSNLHTEHKTTLAEFTPSKENERFYYPFTSAVHKKVGENQYELVTEEEGVSGKLNPENTYYHRRYIFTDESDEPIFFYEEMSDKSIEIAVWDATFETRTHEVGAWVVESGTPARELEMYSEQKAKNSPTKSAEMIFYPYLTEQNDTCYVDMNLGNNGLLEVTPAQGIKLSKMVDIKEENTSLDFSFRITVRNANGTPYTGLAEGWTSALDVVPTNAPSEIRFSSQGTYTVELSADQTFWLTGLPTGATYTVEEISDNADYKVKSVHINGISTGTIATDTIAAYDIDDVRFVNTAMGEGDLVITKQVVAANNQTVDIADSVKFKMRVALTDPSGAPVSGTFESSNGRLTVPANGIFEISLSEGRSFVVRNLPEKTKYEVTEVSQEMPAGFTFNAARSSLRGEIDASGNDQALIVNNYVPVKTNGSDISIAITKEISGNRTTWLDGEQYDFTVSAIGTGTLETEITSFSLSKNKTSHTLTLSGEEYTAAGTYHYKISETAGAQGGVTYDTADRRFDVVVADRDMDGDLEIVSVDNVMNTTVTGEYLVSANFNNVYRPIHNATVTFGVQKKVTADRQISLAGYQFALYNESDISTADEVIRSTFTNAQGEASFTLNYAANRATMEGTQYTYYMAEVDTGNPNIIYDDAIYKVVVTVTDMGDGTTKAEADISVFYDGTLENGVSVFTNVYQPSESDFVTILGRKEIDGNRVLNANEFSFKIERDASNPNAPLPATTTVTNAANGSFAFPAITFTDEHKGKEYCYVISELNNDPIGGFTYDAAVYKVYISVVDNGDATLTAEIERIERVAEQTSTTASEIVFTNKYVAKPTTVSLSGSKLLTGKKLLEEEFTFRLAAITPNAPMPNGATTDSVDVKNDAAGKIAFEDIKFEAAGTYRYRLTEVAGTDDRFDYDGSVYLVTVTVRDNSQGQLLSTVSLLKNNMSSSEVIFENGFVPTTIYYDIHNIEDEFGGSKELSGRPLEEGEFAFRLINAVNGQQIGEPVYNDENGDFRFPEIPLASAGIYHFKIEEMVGTEKGVTYDTSTYHIRLEVVQNDTGDLIIKDKKLFKGTISKQMVGGILTEVTDYADITEGGSIVFENDYKADPAHVTLQATKILTGRDLIDGEFRFDLHQTEDDNFTYNEETLMQDDVVLSLQDDGTGNITFMPMQFDEVGTYYYVIVEDALDEKGITADKTVYKITITVTDNHKGNLIAAIRVGDTDVIGSTAKAVRFHNTYEVAATEIVITGTKKLKGRDLQADEFSFELYDHDNVKLETVTNSTDGSFAFTAIPVTQAGEYIYTVREVTGDDENVAYDDAVYRVTVTVSDNLDGTYRVQYAYTNGTQIADGVLFTNVYTAPKPAPEPIPDMESPKTGDSVNLWMWFAFAWLSGGVFATSAIYGKKKRTLTEEN